MTYREARRTAEDVLPGVRYRRHIKLRYTLAWRCDLSPDVPDGTIPGAS